MGKKKITTADEFREKILDFIEFTKAQEIPPTDHALYEYLGLRPSEYENLCKGKDKDGSPWPHPGINAERRKEFEERDKIDADDAVKKLVAYREDRLVKELEKSRTTSSNVIFQLKQAKNGGYQDLIQSDQQANVTIKIDGIGGLDSFK